MATATRPGHYSTDSDATKSLPQADYDTITDLLRKSKAITSTLTVDQHITILSAATALDMLLILDGLLEEIIKLHPD